jgi:hypothetical protein
MMEGRLQNWLQIIGLVGVIASLIFVGFEIKQSRDIAIAQTYQDRASLDIQVRSYMAPSERVYEAMQKSIQGAELSPLERIALDRALGNIFIYWETNHLLFEMGMLDDEHWEASLRSIDNMSKVPRFDAAWNDEKASFRVSFQNIVDARLTSQE